MTTTEPAIIRPNIQCRHGGTPEPYSPVSLERMREHMRFYDAESVAPRMLATLDHEREVLLGLVRRLVDQLGPVERAAVRDELAHELSVFRRFRAEIEAIGGQR